MGASREWIIDAFDCAAPRIAGETGREALMSLFANVIRSVNLHPVGQAVWQIMPAGAVTGMVALVESHLTCHSDPALSYVSLNLLSNRTEVSPDFEGLLTRFVGARRVDVRVVERGVGAAPSASAPPEAAAPNAAAPNAAAPNAAAPNAAATSAAATSAAATAAAPVATQRAGAAH